MAITNAQQYQQLVNKPANGKRPGYRGPGGYQGSNAGPTGPGGQSPGPGGQKGGSNTGPGGGGNNNNTGGNGNNNYQDRIQRIAEQKKREKKAADERAARNREKERVEKARIAQELFEKRAKEKKDKQKQNEIEKVETKKKKFSFKNFLNDIQRQRFIDSLSTLERKELEMQGFDFNNLSSNLFGNKDISSLDALNAFGYKSGKYGPQFDDDGNNIFINTGGGGGDGGNINTTPITPKSPIEETQEEVNPRDYTGIGSRFLGSQFDFTGLADGGIARAGYMDGGRMKQIEMMEDEDDPVGGIMDLESARDMYFVGGLVKSIKKGVKKATKAVKKIAKSPIGKLALGYALTGGLGNLAAGSGFGGMFKGFMSPTKFLARSKLGGIFSKLGTKNILGSVGDLSLGKKIGLGLGVPFALDALGVGKDDDDQMDLDEYYRRNGIDIADIRMNPYNYLAPRMVGSKFAADGGLMRMGYQEGGDAEPVAKKTMPLLDMDGMEKDYREDGGFVPIGRMERADDVPARLSKNEFVFTADAVRNAGEGDIDKGAEVMYNMMKNLESGGEVSEESQGLDGAREMFKTSQRLEEVL
jgi:hypothetical protein